MVRSARLLKKEKGILAEVKPKQGRPLSKEVEICVRQFYEDDEFSRLMPGKKDYVSIGGKEHRQKRLLLCDLHELYASFRRKNTDAKISLSKFCSLRPKWCVPVSSSGAHNVCVCTYHQNTILLVDAINWNFNYKDLMKVVVCDTEKRECMIHRCESCPGSNALCDFIKAQLCDMEDEEVSFNQWKSTDRSTLIKQTLSVDEYTDILVESIDKLTSHSFLAKCQARYLKQCKDELSQNECIVLLDFVENFKFVVQDEVQSFHWNNLSCTLHPVVIYFKDSELKLQEASLCILSDDMNHDTCFVHEVQHILVSYIKEKLSSVHVIHYYSDGCAEQYKNYKNFVNLCYHHKDFGIFADWTFFATSHGKSPCDGIDGTVKRLTTRASLQRPLNDQIITAELMFQFCKSSIPVIHFELIKQEDMVTIREEQLERFKEGRTVPGTRSYHFFEPLEKGIGVCFKRTSYDPDFVGSFYFDSRELSNVTIEELRPMQFVACEYDNFWWMGLIQSIDEEHADVEVKFLHPHGPLQVFQWPEHEDICFVPITHILCVTDAPNTATGRSYSLSDKDYNRICEKFSSFANN